MNEIDWALEPDLPRLKALQQLLPVSPIQAVPGLEALASEGSAMSAFYLADHYRRSPQGNQAMALQWYEAAQALGSPQAAHLAGRLRLKQGDTAAAFAAFTAGAAKGYLPAVYQLANMHRLGTGTSRNLPRCIQLLRQAEAGGHLYARRDLAGLMLAGKLGLASIASGSLMLAHIWVDLACAPFWKDGLQDERLVA